MRQVPFFNYPSVYERFASEFQAALEDVGSRGAFIQQRDVEELEQTIADYVGVKHCVAVANATDGLQMALMAGDLTQGGEVIISTHTMVATAAAIHFAGGVAIPVDVGPDHTISAEAVRQAVTPDTVAICPTQLNGRTTDMDAIMSIAEEHGLDVYEDAAQGLGSKYKGRSAGSWGKGSCLSFYPSKILGTLGDGGAVLTSDDEVADSLRLMRDHGRVDRGDTAIWGFNSRLDNLSAAFLNIQVRVFDETVRRRRELAARYHERLVGLPGITLPEPPADESDHFDTFQNYELECHFRDDLQVGLKQRGVGTLQQWGGWPIHRFTRLGFDQVLPNADALFDRMLMLPMNLSLSDDDVDYVCEAVEAIASARG